LTFLATTALDDFWDKDAQKGVFLGEWCKLYTQKNEYEKLQFDTLKYIWKDAYEIDLAIKYCEDIYDQILTTLIEILNKYHNINKDYLYWNTLLKPWLFTYIQIMYDKYRHLKLVINEYEDIYTYTMDENDYKYIFTPDIFSNNVVNSDAYNLQIYSQIIKFLNIEYKNKRSNFKNTQIEIKSSIKEKIYRTLSKILNKVFSQNKILVVAPYFKSDSLYKILKLSLKSKFLFVFDNLTYHIQLEAPINIKQRQSVFEDSLSNVEFVNLVIHTLRYNLPTIYFENYKNFSQKVNELNIEIPNVLYSSNALHSNEIFKFYLSENIHNLKFVYGQHGGGIGIDRVNTVETIERSLAHVYCTFGWKEKNTVVLELPSFLNKNKETENINFIMTAMPRYFYRFTYLADGTKMLDYIENSKIFLANVQNVNNLVVRCYMQDYKWSVKSRLLEVNKNIKFNNKINYYKQVENAKLNIFDHMHTGYLETLSMNLPTVIIIPKNVYYFRDSAKPYIQKLKDVHILFDEPIKASKFVDEIYDNIDQWWFAEEVQKIREEFCYQYARTSEDWMDDWIVTFKNIINSDLIDNEGKLYDF